MVVAMMRRPPERALLARRLREERQAELPEAVELVRAMTEVAVVAAGDAEHPHQDSSPRPARERPAKRNDEHGSAATCKKPKRASATVLRQGSAASGMRRSNPPARPSSILPRLVLPGMTRASGAPEALDMPELSGRGLLGESLLDRGWLPDWLIRAGIRRIVAGRLREQEQGGVEAQSARFAALLDELDRSSIAVSPDAANAQHYELPPAFFEQVLGPTSQVQRVVVARGCGDASAATADAELRTLELTVERAQLEDGQRHPGARLRLGLAHVVHGGAVSRLAHRRPSRTRHRSAPTSCGRRRRAASPMSKSSPPTSTPSLSIVASIASSRSRCSSTSATTARSSRASASGCGQMAGCSSTSSRTAALRIRSKRATVPTGWRATSSLAA